MWTIVEPLIIKSHFTLFVVVQLPSHVPFFATPWTAACQASLSLIMSQSLPKFMSIELMMPSNHLSLCCPLLWLQSSPASESFPTSLLFASGGQSIGASASVLPIKYSMLISFRIDWLDLPAVQGTLKSLPQHHSSKASILQHSAFFMVQLSHLYMTTRKTIALTRRIFVGKVISLLFNTLSRFVSKKVSLQGFPPRSNCFLNCHT